MRSALRHTISQRKRWTSSGNPQIVAVYGNVMNRQNVTKWCREFSEGRTDVHNEQRSGKPSLISDDLLQEIEGEICPNRRVTIRKLHHIIPEVSKTTIHETVTVKLGYRKLCAAPFRAAHHCASGKIQVGYIGPSAVHSGPRGQRFPNVSSPKETYHWEKVRRRWWAARRSHDMVQRAGGKLLWLGDTEAGSQT